ncbi:hypothetical protein UCDDA912_g00114 [Diaporthe ampelina]|uniref:Uncharacterized protein n=1 Tax=Diaporthe ampelina TaxID=1214573 RepID=A0A0G2G140_9PEZI|nr:hypothetical protein UCDDA912_g00114 [Diaporthe ampelina]
MLANNTRNDYYVDHLSAQHGIDIPSMRRTTDAWYLKRKTNNTLRSHIVQEAAELNELNTKISQLEGCLAVEPPAVPYQSRHGFDVTTIFETDQAQLPSKKSDLVTYLRDMRAERNKAGALYTRPGVTDTREAVLDDLETLLDELLDEE